MPKSALHDQKLRKNIAVLAIILGFCALIWAVTVIKISGNAAQQTALPQTEAKVE